MHDHDGHKSNFINPCVKVERSFLNTVIPLLEAASQISQVKIEAFLFTNPQIEAALDL